MHKLFVVGFSRATDELQLNELFTQHGLVRTLTIIRDQQTGISKGYAFVQMLDAAGAERAILHLNRLCLEDRTLTMRYADIQPGKRQPRSIPNKRSMMIWSPAGSRRTPRPRRSRL